VTVQADPPTRHVRFDALFNVRDLGGYHAADDRTTRWQTLYRADGINRVGGDDLGRLADLQLRTVLDLRTHVELDERGRFPVDQMPVTYHHLPVIRETWESWDTDVEVEPVAFLVERYQEMLVDGAPALAGALEVLADPDSYPAVFHCAAGKDRTGVLAAVLLGLLGVSEDDIAEDYALSALAMVALVEWIRVNVPEALDTMTDQPPAFLAAPSRAMHELLVHIRGEFGSMVGYATSIGVDRSTVEALRHNLLADADAVV
jgi:protein-tyrosine phosphatase